MLKEFALKFPVVGEVVKKVEITQREEKLAHNLHRQWSTNEIDFTQVMSSLRKAVQTHGIDENRTMLLISKHFEEASE
ncbi:hypothetical protein A2V80_01050 [Candidatus Woesebacteria bacterium RBG_16_39_8b]|uniref:Uncharacterized protein n=1 Tax=Candidatus Woesebacteria bacterium RBG_16_39_8b TaxID=1802482 RepID=A0A1F7XDT0_9BACT|nr:MAG: hypothetical protein A2V80_01050 [Candidatus Woesebacteria bacterium RBG_16_39_8b]